MRSDSPELFIPVEYKGFSSETYFTQLAIASEVQQGASGFPTKLVSLQRELELCIHKVSWGFGLLCAVLA